MATAGNERGLSLRSPGRFLAAADRLVDAVAARRRPPTPRCATGSSTRGSAPRPTGCNTWGTVTGSPTAATLGAESARSTRCSGPSSTSRLHETALDLLGADGASCADARWMDGYLFSLSGPIYAGTNEIQRNIVAERLLGLPKADR